MRERLVADIPRELAQVNATGNTLAGYASVFNYPIPGWMGQTTFIRPKAFARTIERDRDQMQVMFNHGHDPRYGELPIGTISKLEENRTGLYTEVELHDGPDNENIRAALRSGALRSMSIQFETEQESFSEDHSERYIEQVKLWEFGPVAFPANAAATASLHSAFDWLERVKGLESPASSSLEAGTKLLEVADAEWLLDAARKFGAQGMELLDTAARLKRLGG